MAIKINIEAYIGNLKKLKNQLQEQLGKVQVGTTKTGAGSKVDTELKKNSQAVNLLINKYKALDITRAEFIKKSKTLLSTLPKDNKFLQIKGKLVQKLNAAEKTANAEKIAYEKKRARALIESTKIETTANQRRLAMARESVYKAWIKELDQLTSAFRKGEIGLKQFSNESTNYINKLKLQETALKSLKSSTQDLVTSRKASEASIKSATRAYEQEIAASKKLNQAKREEQAITAATNRLKKAVSTGSMAKDISSIKTYNALAKRQMEMFKAGKIGAKDFLRTTDQLLSQQSNFMRMDNKLAAQLISNRSKVIKSQQKVNAGSNSSTKATASQTKNVKALNETLKSYIGNMGMVIKKFSDWLIVGSLVYAPIRAFQDMISTIREMDDALTDLNKVVDLSGSQLEQMRDASIELGKQTGVSSVEIMKSMAEFGRVTKLMTEITDLAKAATVASNVTTMSADDAAKAITSIMITFKKDASEAMAIIDSMNEIQNNYRTSAEDVAASIGRVGAAARQASTSMEDLSGYTTAMVSATGMSGSQAGTAIKSIISRVYRIGTEGESSAGAVEEALADINIAVRDTSGEFRDFDSILYDLSQQWNELSTVTKSNVAQTIAGTYHYSKFIALMDNFELSMAATTKSINSQDSALVENAKYLDSITGKLGILRATLEEKYFESLDAETLKKAITILTRLVTVFGSLNQVVLVTIGLFAIWKSTQLTSMLVGLLYGVKNLTFGWAAYSAVALTATTRTANLYTAISKLGMVIKSNWVGILIAAITAVVFAMKSWRESQQKSNAQIEEMNQKLRLQQKIVSESTTYYMQNYKEVQTNLLIKQELLAIEEQLVEEYGLLAEGLDLVNGKYEENSDILEKIKSEQIEMALGTLDQQYDPDKKFDLESLRTYDEDLWLANTELAKGGRVQVDKYIEGLEHIKKTMYENMHVTLVWGDLVAASYKDKISLIEIVNRALREARKYEEKALEVEEMRKEIIGINIKSGIEFNEVTKKIYDILSEPIEYQSYEQYSNALQGIKDKIIVIETLGIDKQFKLLDSQISTGVITWDKYRDTVEETIGLLEQAGLTKEQVQSVLKIQTGLKKVDLTSEEITQAYENANTKLEHSKEIITEIDSALSQLDDEEFEFGVSLLDNMEYLLEKFPILLNHLKDEKGIREVLNRAASRESKSAQEYYQEKIEASEEFYDIFISSYGGMFAGLDVEYQKDIRNYSTALQLKNDLFNKSMLVQQRRLEIIQEISELADSNEGVDADAIDKLREEDALLAKQDAEWKKIGEKVNDYNSEIATSVQLHQMSIDNFKRLKQEASNTFDTVIDKLNQTGSALDDLENQDAGFIDTEPLLELIKLYPHLNELLNDQKALHAELTRLHNEESVAARTAYSEMMTYNDDFMDKVFSNNADFWDSINKSYETDLWNYKTYLDLKDAMSLASTNLIGMDWDENLEDSLKKIKEKQATVRNQSSFFGQWPEIQEQIDDVVEWLEIKVQMKKEISGMFGKIDFKSIGRDRAETNETQKEAATLTGVEADRYIELNAALQKVNNQLTINKENQSKANDDTSKRIVLLDQEAQLIKNQAVAYQNLLAEMRKERGEKEKILRSLGVTFSGEGEAKFMTNIRSLITKAKGEVDKAILAGDETWHERANKAFDALNEPAERFNELQDEVIAGTIQNILVGTTRLGEIVNEKIQIRVDKLVTAFEELEKVLDSNDEKISDLENSISLLGDTDFSDKISILKKESKIASDNVAFLEKEISRLEKTNDTAKAVQEEVNRELESLRVRLKAGKISIKEFDKAVVDMTNDWIDWQKTQADTATSAFIEAFNAKIQKQIDKLEELSNIDSDLADQRLKNNKLEIDGIDAKLDKLNDEKESLDEIAEREKRNKDLRKQEELVENLKKEKTLMVYKAGAGWIHTIDNAALAEEQDNLKEMQDDFATWERDLAITKLENEKSDLEEANQVIIDAYNKKIKFLEDLFIDEADIIKNDTLVIESWKTFYENLDGVNKIYFDKAEKGFINHIANIKKIVDESDYKDINVDDMLGDQTIKYPNKNQTTENESEKPIVDTVFEDTKVASVNDSGTKQTFKERMVAIMDENSKKWSASTSLTERQELADKNTMLGKNMGWTRDSNGIWYDEEGMRVYKNGGLVDFTGMAWLDGSKSRPERVLSAEQNNMFTKLMDSFPNFINGQKEKVTEIYNITVDKIQTNDALGFINNMKKLIYNKGRGA